MKVFKRGPVLSMVIGLLVADCLVASPFTLPKGEGTVTVSASAWKIDQYLDFEGEEVDLGPDFDQTSFLIGLDHGLTDRLTLMMSLPVHVNSERTVLPGDTGVLATNDGVGDAQIQLKMRLNNTESPFKVALILGAKWPGDYEPDVANSPGDGNFDSELLLSIGRQVGAWTWSLDAGYRARSGEPADEYVARGDLAYLINPRYYLFGSVTWVDSQSGLAITSGTPAFFPFSATEEDIVRGSLGFLWTISARYGAFVTYSETFDGKNTALGEEIGFGLTVSY